MELGDRHGEQGKMTETLAIMSGATVSMAMLMVFYVLISEIE